MSMYARQDEDERSRQEVMNNMDDVLDVQSEFKALRGQTWLNCAHQGPLPRCAAEEAHEAVSWKTMPWELTSERFSGVPLRLRQALGALIGAPADDIILANSTSYGLHLLANGIPWGPDDEILVMRGDFPSDILPWLDLERRGVRIKRLEPEGRVLRLDEVAAALSPRSRLLCLTWVHSFSGFAIDLEAIGQLCRDHGVIFVANASQALGVRPLDVASTPVDAVVSAGWKWLCGPYATGFVWMRPSLRDSLEYNQNYWLATLTADDLGGDMLDLKVSANPGARKYDVFCPSNFFNFKPFASSVEFLLSIGVEAIARHDGVLVDRLIKGLDRQKYKLLSPETGLARSTLVFVSHVDRARNAGICERLKRSGVHVAHRAGDTRIAPHVYNTPADIDRALEALNTV